MKEPLIVIGITGKARSGKDTIAKILETRHGFTRIALADGLRSAFRDMDGPTWELTKDLECNAVSQRWALQTLGTECRVMVHHPRLFIGLVLAKIAYLARYHPVPRTRFVIPDIRFKVESLELGHDVAASLGGRYYQWRVIRPNAGLAGSLGLHSSEMEMDQIPADCDIHNGATIVELETQVNLYAGQLLKGQQ